MDTNYETDLLGRLARMEQRAEKAEAALAAEVARREAAERERDEARDAARVLARPERNFVGACPECYPAHVRDGATLYWCDYHAALATVASFPVTRPKEG